MDFYSFADELKRIFSANSCLPIPTDSQCEKLYRLTERMLEVNKTMNLTAITEEKAVILKHYGDSVSVSNYIPKGAKVIDIGCGAGFPSLPLAIFREDLEIVSLDSTAKRIEYVRSTAEMLGLENVTAITGRAEDYAKKSDFRESFDVAVARAVAGLPVLCELCLPFVRIGGAFVAMKAAKGEEETEEASRAIELCGGRAAEKYRLELTADNESFETRTIVKIEKIQKTPDKYPRNYSQIAKKHL